jgi:hypothetical protein
MIISEEIKQKRKIAKYGTANDGKLKKRNNLKTTTKQFTGNSFQNK